MAFDSFKLLCERSNIPLCKLVGPYDVSSSFGKGIVSQCYARSIILANTMIFNIGTVFVHLGTLIMIAMAVYTIYAKYTAVGRREMLDLFYLFFFLEVWTLIVDAGVSPSTSKSYPYIVAVQLGLSSAFCCLLMLTSLLGYQFWEDGTFKSVWTLRIISASWAIIVFLVALFTFNGYLPNWPSTLNPNQTTPLMVLLYAINGLFVFLASCLMFYLTGVLLGEWWAFGAYALALFFLISGQLLMYAFGKLICESTRHYIDGIFFGTVCNLFAFLMVYRAYDTLTAEDLEFTVSPNDSHWDSKSSETFSQYALSNYNLVIPP